MKWHPHTYTHTRAIQNRIHSKRRGIHGMEIEIISIVRVYFVRRNILQDKFRLQKNKCVFSNEFFFSNRISHILYAKQSIWSWAELVTIQENKSESRKKIVYFNLIFEWLCISFKHMCPTCKRIAVRRYVL